MVICWKHDVTVRACTSIASTLGKSMKIDIPILMMLINMMYKFYKFYWKGVCVHSWQLAHVYFIKFSKIVSGYTSLGKDYMYTSDRYLFLLVACSYSDKRMFCLLGSYSVWSLQASFINIINWSPWLYTTDSLVGDYMFLPRGKIQSTLSRTVINLIIQMSWLYTYRIFRF